MSLFQVTVSARIQKLIPPAICWEFIVTAFLDTLQVQYNEVCSHTNNFQLEDEALPGGQAQLGP